LAWSSDPATLDPALAVDVVGGSAVSLLFAGLVAFDADGRIVPSLAESWELSPDGTTYVFRLRAGAAASDGSALGAEEVAASFRRLLDSAVASPRSWVLERIAGAGEFRRGDARDVEGLRVRSPAELEIRLTKPSASFLALLAMPNAAVVPAGVTVSGEVATGPWVLQEHVRDSRLVLRRNPRWFGKAPSFDGIVIRILPEEFTRGAEFEVGNLDVIDVPPAESKRFRETYGDRVVRQVALVTEYIGLNHDDPVLSDTRVRRALNHAVDVDRILEHVLQGRGVRAAGAVPPSLPGGGGAQPFAHDPDLARRLLAEANVPSDWVLELWQRPSPLGSQVLEAVQADLRRVGVRAEIRVRDWSALKSAIDRGETQAFYMNWYADYPDPENFLVPLFHSANVGGGGNRARLRDPEIDALLAELDLSREAEARARLAGEIDRRIHEGAPWIYLWHPVLEVCVSDRVRGYRPHAVSTCERWVDVTPAGAGAAAR
jgi:peptide/nickel transport system substrate-binding protein/oligopeptide transport system substrate-binding protein